MRQIYISYVRKRDIGLRGNRAVKIQWKARGRLEKGIFSVAQLAKEDGAKEEDAVDQTHDPGFYHITKRDEEALKLIRLLPLSSSLQKRHRGDLNQLRSQDRAVNQNRSRESQENMDSRLQSFEQIMEIGHKERGPSELTFEQLEHKFQDEIKRLITRHSHIEDEEIARHKEVSDYVILKVH
ncbi:hypothetical protein Tco_1137465 [Tanacetum coccineum]